MNARSSVRHLLLPARWLTGVAVLASLALPVLLHAETADSVTQYGITWKFDKAYPVGKFVTGDYWVVGPVKVVSVDPPPGPGAPGEPSFAAASRYGDKSMKDDAAMRNGSMIVLKPDTKQGYDSRLLNYEAALTQTFPLDLPANRSLISTISNLNPAPQPVLLSKIMWRQESEGRPALKTAAVLTCLDKEPPADAFRPPYAGTEKPIYETKNLQWELLPKLAPVVSTPSIEQFARYYERPWLDHINTWLFQVTGPLENQANYGREFARAGSMASLLLMLDLPKEKKEKLLLGFVQFGIDLRGLEMCGRTWTPDGGHWSGRKWPIIFAGLMLGEKSFATAPAGTVFPEDEQTYVGKGFAGQTALYQMVFMKYKRTPYEEKDPTTWTKDDQQSEGYRVVNAQGWAGTALAVQLMGAKPQWNHDVFFDYCDRWMAKDDPYAAQRGTTPRPEKEAKLTDPFVQEMWDAYRAKAPAK